MCKDVRLSMGEELPVMQEVVCGEAFSETTPLEDPLAMDCAPPLEVVSVPEDTVVPSLFLLAEASSPSSSTVVQTDGSIVVTTESIVMVDSPVDKSSGKGKLPKCFSEDRNSGNDHVMCLHALDSLSIAILGRTD